MTAQQAPHSPPMETTRAPMSMTMFVLLGAAGFGIAGAISARWFPLGVLLGGALGGAMLGLAFKDLGRVVSMALLGLMGLAAGLVAGIGLMTLSAKLLGLDSEALGGTLMIASVGAGVGASLGLTLFGSRMIGALAAAGAVGFGAGAWLSQQISQSIPTLAQLGEGESFVINLATIGVIGGASLGAALGYLESRKQAQERRARVR